MNAVRSSARPQRTCLRCLETCCVTICIGNYETCSPAARNTPQSQTCCFCGQPQFSSPAAQMVLVGHSRHAVLGVLTLHLGRVTAELLELGPAAATVAVADAAAEVLTALDRLAPTEQQRLIGAIACARAAGDAVLRVACGEFEQLGTPSEHRALAASSGSTSGSSSSSGSGGSGSSSGDSCPYKDGHHHAANRVRARTNHCASSQPYLHTRSTPTG